MAFVENDSLLLDSLKNIAFGAIQHSSFTFALSQHIATLRHIVASRFSTFIVYLYFGIQERYYCMF
jgi:hypothetical protein